jgi:hypothetical protein
MTERCAKCDAEPRSGKSRLGKACLAADRKVKRAGVGVSESDTGVSESDTSDTLRHDVTAGVESPPVRTLDVARARIVALEDEVRRLKRELSAARVASGDLVPIREPLDAVGISPGGRGKVSGCGHGQFCGLIACRAGRA